MTGSKRIIELYRQMTHFYLTFNFIIIMFNELS